MDTSDIGQRAVQRITVSASVIIVNTLTTWTDTYFGMVQGLCISLMGFIISTQLNQNQTQSRLIKRITLLYCNQQVRKLITLNDLSPTSIFSNIMLAVALAIITMMIYDRNKEEDTKDLKSILEGLVYLYGDMFDFAFKYGILKITVAAFGVSMILRTMEPSKTKIQKFILRLASIVSMNLLSEGTAAMIQSSSTKLEIIKCIASLTILRQIFPSMEAYLTYLTAVQLLQIIPNTAPLLFCAILWLKLLPRSSRDWLSETFFIYIILTISRFTAQTPLFYSTILIVVLAHYTDFIIQSKLSPKKI